MKQPYIFVLIVIILGVGAWWYSQRQGTPEHVEPIVTETPTDIQTSPIEQEDIEVTLAEDLPLEPEVPFSTYTNDGRYVHTMLGVSIPQPDGVYLVHEDEESFSFSLLAPDDPQRQSSNGLLSMLIIKKKDRDYDTNETVTINGVEAFVDSSIGAYGGEEHRTYIFPDDDITVYYLPGYGPRDRIYGEMIDAMEFGAM